MAQGKLSERIEIPLPGRLGDVGNALNGTVISLREMLGRIESVVETVEGAAKHIATVNNTLSAHAQDQAASLEETASSMEELNAVVQQNAETAE